MLFWYWSYWRLCLDMYTVATFRLLLFKLIAEFVNTKLRSDWLWQNVNPPFQRHVLRDNKSPHTYDHITTHITSYTRRRVFTSGSNNHEKYVQSEIKLLKMHSKIYIFWIGALYFWNLNTFCSTSGHEYHKLHLPAAVDNVKLHNANAPHLLYYGNKFCHI